MNNEVMYATGSFDSQYCGPPEGVHGGHVAALMDELLGVTCVMSGHGGYTGTLTVRYRSLTPLDVELQATAWVEEIKDRKAMISGRLQAGDRVCAEAEGLFIKPKT
jgi:acyl-coenzyme A thioesterase PaaI-like protein